MTPEIKVGLLALSIIASFFLIYLLVVGFLIIRKWKNTKD